MKSTIKLAIGTNSKPVIKIKHDQHSDDIRDQCLNVFLDPLNPFPDSPVSKWLKIRNIFSEGNGIVEYEITPIAANDVQGLRDQIAGMEEAINVNLRSTEKTGDVCKPGSKNDEIVYKLESLKKNLATRLNYGFTDGVIEIDTIIDFIKNYS